MRDNTLRDAQAMSDELLAWYDRHAREMPWRVAPADRRSGVMPDPYAVWLSEVMLQQTTVAAVRDYFTRFRALWPDVHALAGAEDPNATRWTAERNQVREPEGRCIRLRYTAELSREGEGLVYERRVFFESTPGTCEAERSTPTTCVAARRWRLERE